MKKSTGIYLACMAIACGLHASAQERGSLVLLANNAEGIALMETPVDLESKLRFSQEGVELYSQESLTAVFHYADTKTISFRYDSSTSVAEIGAASELRLRSNPVDSELEFIGFSGEPCSLSVCGLKGETIVNIPAWSGEAVDVTSLAPGLYIARTGDDAVFKFIKR